MPVDNRQILTTRTTARPPTGDDFALLRILHRDPRVAATISADRRPLAEDATRAALAAAIGHWCRHGFGVRYFFCRADGGFIGYCGLRHATVQGREEIELLYAIRPEYWRKGYGAEMARASIGEGFAVLGLGTIVSFTLPTNAGSRGVMERCGMRYERDITHAGLPHVLYRIHREEFAPD